MKYIFLIILGFVFLVSCSTPTKEINELSTQNGPFQVVENQDSIKIYHQEKLFTGTAIQYLNKTQILLKVEYSKGLINGKLLKYNKAGNVVIDLNSTDGFNDGLVKTFYDNGNLKETSFYSNGKLNGTLQSYFENGKLQASRFYDKKGKGNGIFKRYDSIGNLVGTISVKDDKFNGLSESFQYDKENNVIESNFSNYKNSILEGKSYVLNKEKDTVYSANYINGLMEGISKTVINKKGDYTLTDFLKGKKKGRIRKFKSNGAEIIVKKKKRGITDLRKASIKEVIKSMTGEFKERGFSSNTTLKINKNNTFKMIYDYDRKQAKYNSGYVERADSFYRIVKGTYKLYKINIWKWNRLNNTQPTDKWGDPIDDKLYNGYNIVFKGVDNRGNYHTMCGVISQRFFDGSMYRWKLLYTNSVDGNKCSRGNSKNREIAIPSITLNNL